MDEKMFTQDEVNALIKERLERSEKKMAEKYADYFSPEDVKNKTADLEKQVSEMGISLEEAKKKSSEFDELLGQKNKEIDRLTAEAKKHATDAVKSRIAYGEFKLPNGFADRLKGDTEEEIRKDAEFFSKSFARSMPLGNAEIGDNAEDPKANYKKLVATLNKG